MSEQLYRVCLKIDGETEFGWVLASDFRRAPATSKGAASSAADEGNRVWGRMIVHWIEPSYPPYTPPAITAEMDLETRAGSPGCVDGDDLLGVKPPGC